MALKPMGPAAPKTATEFAKGTPVKVLPTPRQNRVKSGDDPTAYALNIAFFGPTGTGKTLAAEPLIRQGKKVLFVQTDLGDNGTLSIKLALKKQGLSHLAANYKMLSITSFEEMEEFCHEPAAFFPEIYDWDPDFLYVDGFSFFQQTSIMERAGEMIQENNEINIDKGSKEKEVSELRSSGFKFELSDYAVVRNMTLRTVGGLCRVHNKKTGKLWHKFYSFAESVKSKGADSGGGFVETASPLLTGAGGTLMQHAFDLIIKTSKKGGEFLYQIELGDTAATKNRGFSLEPKMKADFEKVWSTICSDLDIQTGAVDPSVIAPVLVAGE